MKADFKRKKIPLSKAGKYLSVTNPYSAHSSAAKSYNASATKSATKPTLPSSQSGNKANPGPSAFLAGEASVTPYKRSRLESGTFGQEKLFAQTDTSAKSKKSAKPTDRDNQQQSQDISLTPLIHENPSKQIVIDAILDDEF